MYGDAILGEYGFDGSIMHVQYDVDMLEIIATTRIRKSNVNDGRISSAAEFEIEGRATNNLVRLIA
jgi:hypothetical protein